MKITVTDFLEAVQGELDAFVSEVTEDTKKAVKTVAKKTVREIKKNSPVRYGYYKKSWTQTTLYDGANGITVSIHNEDHYRLTHLLEHGHAKVNGGRTRAFPHIAPAEKFAERELQREIESKIKG